MRQLLVIILASAWLAGCDSKPPEKTVFDAQKQALKKARDVEQKVQDAAMRQRENIEQQEK